MTIGTEITFLMLVFFAVALLALGAVAVFRRDAVARRMQRNSTFVSDETASLRYASAATGFAPIWKRLEKFAVSGDAKDKSTLRLELVRAGYYQPSAVGVYYGTRIIAAIGLALAVTIAVPVLGGGLVPLNAVPVAGIFAAAIGYVAPMIYLKRRIFVRKRSIREGFPDALDMLLICVEAGLGLAAAIERVGLEMQMGHPILAEHFKLIGLETRAGKSREIALKNFANRTGVDEVFSLVTLLHQSQQLGTNLADSLRVHAFEMRAKRLLRAEERANKLPVKIVMPLGLCILPCLLIVIFTPILIRIVRAIAPVSGP